MLNKITKSQIRARIHFYAKIYGRVVYEIAVTGGLCATNHRTLRKIIVAIFFAYFHRRYGALQSKNQPHLRFSGCKIVPQIFFGRFFAFSLHRSMGHNFCAEEIRDFVKNNNIVSGTFLSAAAYA